MLAHTHSFLDLDTVFVAICAIFILPDFPATTKWLTPLERRLAEVRMAEEVSGTFDEGSSKGGLSLATRDWRVWWLAVALFAMVVGLASFQNFFPSKTCSGLNAYFIHRRTYI